MAEHDILPPNSNRSRMLAEEEQRLPERVHGKPIAHRSQTVKTDTLWRRLVKLFLADDRGDVKDYILRDLIIPQIKDGVLNTLTLMLWGERRSPFYSKNEDRTRYAFKSSQLAGVRSGNQKRQQTNEEALAVRKLDLDNIIFDSKVEADDVLQRLIENIDLYGRVPVGYLRELIDEPIDVPWTAEYYGWTDMQNARVRRAGRGWILELPKPERFER